MKFQLERIALFSDAVFAIAITLMIIEIKAPHLEHHVSFREAANKILEMFPIFAGTMLSFFLIGVFWKRHHEIMRYMGAYDSKALSINIALLLSIALLPFSTSFVFENIMAGSPLPLLIYNINYIVATLLNYRLFDYILDPKNNIRSEVYGGDIVKLKRELIFPVFVYVLVIILAFVSPSWASIGYPALVLEKWFVNLGRSKDIKAAEPRAAGVETEEQHEGKGA